MTQHWLEKILFLDLKLRVFTAAYTLFTVLVVFDLAFGAAADSPAVKGRHAGDRLFLWRRHAVGLTLL